MSFLPKSRTSSSTLPCHPEFHPFIIPSASPLLSSKKQEQTDEHELEASSSSSSSATSTSSRLHGSKTRWPWPPHHVSSAAGRLIRAAALCLALSVFFVLLLVFIINQRTKMPAFDDADIVYGTGGEDPSQKSTLPRASNPAVFNETSWSTYRPQLYFGLKNRRPDSPMFGMMWYRQGSAKLAEKLPLRHWAMHEDNVVFMWNKHDGRSFGSQQITDAALSMHTDWFSFGHSSWMARFYVQRKAETKWTEPEALIVYFALQDEHSTMEPGRMPTKGTEMSMLSGKSDAVRGSYNLTVRLIESGHNEEVDGMKRVSAMSVHGEPFVDMAHAHDLVKGALRMQPDGMFAFAERPAEENPNFAALQIDIEEDSIVEVVFQSGADERAPDFLQRFHEKQQSFEKNFSRAFPISSNYSALYHKMGHAALSNLLGGIGVWHGSLWMHSKQFEPPDVAKPYGPFSLMSAIPSRTGFPRGFIWDEGFHNMLIHRFDPELTIQIIGAYLDMMNVNGWIPREIVLGSEAEARIPRAYLVQQDWVANPPMFFYLMRDFIQNPELVEKFRPELLRLYPRLKELFFWIRDSQRGPKQGTFRWHDRNATTNMELNPQCLSSGFDDYPRATHPTDQEYHVDLRCWMAMCSSVLVELAQMAGDQHFLPDIRAQSKLFNDLDMLDRLHWSEHAQQYCDYGLHSTAVKLVPVTTPSGDTILVRKVLKEPHYGFVENVNGYSNLFPMLLRLLPPDSPRLGPLLRQISNPAEFWTPYGLRSMSTLSPYYNAWNSKVGFPYWRSPIWINMNYFAIAALKHYAQLQGPYKDTASKLHEELRNNLVRNVADQYEKTGFLWEHYDDVTGAGGGMHPFTGWTVLILKILSQSY